MTHEQVINKIKACLNLSNPDRNNAEGEVKAAILMAQKLMAKYGISEEEVKEHPDTIEYATEICQHKWDMGFRIPLGNVLAKNFRCEIFIQGKSIVFLGHALDAKICRETFETAYSFIMKKANQAYNRAYQLGRPTKGVFNSYTNGFILGLKEALDAQSTALMVITPPDVTEKFKEMTANWGKYKSHKRKERIDVETLEEGRRDGKNFLNKKALEGA